MQPQGTAKRAPQPLAAAQEGARERAARMQSRERAVSDAVQQMLSQPPPCRRTFCLFGDSLTQFSFSAGGWGAGLANNYQRTADVLCRGFSGYNTRWALPLLSHLFPTGGRPACANGAPSPNLVTVWFGANDAVIPGFGEESRQHVPLDEFKANLKIIIYHIQQAAKDAAQTVHVLLVTPPPVDSEAWQAYRLENFDPPPEPGPVNARSLDNTMRYAAAVVEVGKETSTPVVNLFSAICMLEDWKSLYCDGLHFNQKGNAAVLKAISNGIETHFPALSPGAMEPDFPLHKDIDSINPAISILSYVRKRGSP